MGEHFFLKKAYGLNPFLHEHIGKRSKNIEEALSTQLKRMKTNDKTNIHLEVW